MGAELEVVVSLDAERPSHCPHRWLGPWPLAVPTRASPQCLTRTHAPQSGCMAVLGYRCTAFNWGAISRPQASYTGLHPTDARSKSEYSLTHSLTHSKWFVIRGALFGPVIYIPSYLCAITPPAAALPTSIKTGAAKKGCWTDTHHSLTTRPALLLYWEIEKAAPPSSI